MKTKVVAIAATALLGGGIALHMGHEPKCLMKMGIIKKQKEVKPTTVTVNLATPAHLAPAQSDESTAR